MLTVVFLILSTLTIAGAVAAMTLRNLIHAVLALVVAFAGLAALYLSLGAQFVGFAQILVYVGAVAILAVFAILLTRGASLASEALPARKWIAGFIIAAGVFGLLARSIAISSVAHRAALPEPQLTVKQIGNALMGPYVLPLEVVGLLLTAALVGAVMIAVDDRRLSR
jgi:NADH-quinone oxidoreductase subunit J